MNNTSTIAHLEALRDDYYRKYKSIDETITLLKSDVQIAVKTPIKKDDGYDSEWSTKNKLVHILKTQGKFLHIRQIAKLLNEYEPSILEKDFISKLYPAIADLKKTKTIVKVSEGTSNQNTFWGSKNWVDDNGAIKAGYEYDKSEIKNTQSETIDI